MPWSCPVCGEEDGFLGHDCKGGVLDLYFLIDKKSHRCIVYTEKDVIFYAKESKKTFKNFLNWLKVDYYIFVEPKKLI